MKRIAVVLLITSLAAPTHAARRRTSSPPLFPQCRSIEGFSAVTFTRDGGATTIAPSQALHGIGYTFGLASLDVNTLLAVHNNTVALSTDSGCTWKVAGDVFFDYPPSITAARNGVAYIWSDNREGLARFENGKLTPLKPPTAIIGLAVDAATPSHLRVGGSDGTLWESFDSGASWDRRGSVPAQQFPLFYRAAFDPHDLDHALFGTASNGAYLTRDGGRSWTQATGFSATGTSNVFNIAVSPADPNVVWAMALDLADDSRGIYRSTDGGATFKRVVKEGTVVLINGPLLAPHPTDPNVLYFVFGTYFQGYGTDLYRYDVATDVVTTRHYAFHDIYSIAFSPADPNVMYFGLEIVERTQP